MNISVPLRHGAASTRPLRLGFLGVGWIGRHRMEAMLATGLAEAVAIADPSSEMLQSAKALAPGAKLVADLDGLLAEELDGIVIATPSALHSAQATQALKSGVSVFCQKPLGRTAGEVGAVINAARAHDRLLGVDLSYRQTEAMQRIKSLLQSQDLGDVYAADLTFHNAYGPDKPWFYDRELSGGGCVINLGAPLEDLALWALDFPEIIDVTSSLMAGGAPLPAGSAVVEDYAVATLTLAGGTVVRLACSWRLQAGCDAIIGANFYGTHGGASMENIDGSFYALRAHRFQGTARHSLAEPQDDWGGLAAATWVRQLALSRFYDPDCEHLLSSARVLDGIYGRGT